MKNKTSILFVSSGNNERGISSIVENQGKSLVKLGYEVIFFTIHGNGIIGYLKNVFRLRSVIKKNRPAIIHAHYSLSGFLASLTLPKSFIQLIL